MSCCGAAHEVLKATQYIYLRSNKLLAVKVHAGKFPNNIPEIMYT